MLKRFILFTTVLAILAGCGKDPKSYTIAEWDALNQKDKDAKIRQLNGEEATSLMRGMMRKAFSGTTLDTNKMTIGDLIKEGESTNDSARK